MIIPNAGFQDSTPLPCLPFDKVHEETFGGTFHLPTKHVVDSEFISEFQNQYLQERTRMACGSYSVGHATNAENVEKKQYPAVKAIWKDLREIQIERYRGDPRYGSYHHDNIRMMEDEWFIAEKYNVSWVTQMKMALYKNNVVSTGSRNIRFRDMAKEGKHTIIIWPWPWHLFCIVGYDDARGVFIVKDSAGTELRDNGLFYIPYTAIHVLYPCIALVTKENEEVASQIEKDKRTLDNAIRVGLTNGHFLEAYAERWQAAIFFARGKEYRKEWRVSDRPDEEWLEIAREQNIRNWDRPEDFVTRYEVALMTAWLLWIREDDDQKTIDKIIRPWIMKESNLESPILREHMVLVVWRATWLDKPL